MSTWAGEGWQDRVRVWARSHHLPKGATLAVKRVTSKGESATHLSVISGAY